MFRVSAAMDAARRTPREHTMKNITIPAMQSNITITLTGERGSWTVTKTGRGGYEQATFTNKASAMQWAREKAGRLNMRAAF